jgi:hypothetical protein
MENKKKQLLDAFEEFKAKVGEITGSDKVIVNIQAVPIEFFDKATVLKYRDKTLLSENPHELLSIYSNDILEQ